jgi:hypothetical protein
MPHGSAPAALCAAVLFFAAVAVSAQSDEKREPKRPSLSLKATPGTGMVPVRISATAEFKGGDDDFRDYYCPTIEWNWGDGTVSEASADCDPYEAGVSQIRRRYIRCVSHFISSEDERTRSDVADDDGSTPGWGILRADAPRAES